MGVFKTEPITWLTHPFLRFRMKASWGFLSLQLQILVRDSIKVDRVPCSGVGACTSSKTNESRSFLLFLNNQVCVSISYIFIQISVKTIPLLPPSGLCFYQDLSLTWSNFPTCNFVCPQTQGYQKEWGDTMSKLPAGLLPKQLVELPLILTVSTIQRGLGWKGLEPSKSRVIII